MKLKVILNDKVPGLGIKDDIVEVSKGYAMNFLFPKGLAKSATPAEIKVSEERKKKVVVKMDVMKEKAFEYKKIIEDASPFEIKVKASKEGTLYGSVSEKEIAKILKEKVKVEVDPKNIEIPEPIKTLGEHNVKVNLVDDKFANIVVNVK